MLHRLPVMPYRGYFAILLLLLALAPVSAQAGHRHGYVSVLAQPAAPVYGFGVPSYQYGWFGVDYRARKADHVGFYGDYWQWGYRRGF